MINFDFNRLCTGCGACADICPKECITIYEDKNGLLMPKVDTSLCIDCHKCEITCPSLLSKHSLPSSPQSIQKCYAAFHRNTDIRHYGSSGSVFYELASQIISKGGVVYGAAMDENLQLKHTRAVDIVGVKRQMKSKYIQSDTKGIYKKVVEDINIGKDVLFVGTPCQCQALHNIATKKQRAHLLIVDFVCHGVPPQSLFNKSIHQFEKDNNCTINNFSFREKSEKELRNIGIGYTTKDGEYHHKLMNPDTFPYCYGFFYHITQRKSCFACQMRKIKRDSDLTLADFWGIDKIAHEIKDVEKGYSMIVTNTEMGGKALAALKDCQINEIEGGLDFCVKRNHAYTKPDNESLMRTLFFWSLRHLGYKITEKHFLQLNPSFTDRLWHSLVYRLDRKRQ